MFCYTPFRIVNLVYNKTDTIIHLTSQMFGTVANGTLPGSNYICSLVKPIVSILGFRKNFWFGMESVADKD